MTDWKLILFSAAMLYLVSWGIYSFVNRDGRYVATVFENGNIAVDGNRCSVVQEEGFRTIKCK